MGGIIWRRIDSRIWVNPDWRALSDDARLLYLFAVSGVHTTSLSGLFYGGVRRMSEDLGWDLQRTEVAHGALTAAGFIFEDPDQPVTYLPGYVSIDPVKNQSILKAWAGEYELVPDCEAKRRWRAEVAPMFENRSDCLTPLFRELFPETVPVTMGDTVNGTVNGTVSGTVNGTVSGTVNGTVNGTVSGTVPRTVDPIEENRIEEDSRRPPSGAAGPPQEAVDLAQLLADCIRERDPKAKLPSNLSKWADAIEKTNRIDGRGWDEIRQVIEWSQKAEFWKDNILSGPTLRKQFTKLVAHMQRDANDPRRGPSAEQLSPDREAEYQADLATEGGAS